MLSKTPPNKAVEPDGVRPNVLRTCVEQLYSILCYIFNISRYGSRDLENVLYRPYAKK